MTDNRVVFDFEVTFSNGGGIQGQDFRLDIDGSDISDRALADYIVEDLRLLMVERVDIVNKRYVVEPHKRKAKRGRNLVDLSHPIHDGMVTYPGLPAPQMSTHLSRQESRSHYEEGTTFHIGRIDMVANTGTYLDAPFHRHADGVDVSGLPLERLVAVPGALVRSDDRRIEPAAFEGVECEGRAVIVRTGWDTHFGTDQYVGEHPHLSEFAAEWLVGQGPALVGIDSANIDDTNGGTRPAHTLLLEAGIPIVEHLRGLDRLPEGYFEITAIPAPVVGMGTFPVRVVASW